MNFLTTRKELVHIVFQQGKTYTIAIFTGPIVIFIYVTRAVVMFDNFSNIRRAPSVRRSCNQRKTRPSTTYCQPVLCAVRNTKLNIRVRNNAMNETEKLQ